MTVLLSKRPKRTPQEILRDLEENPPVVQVGHPLAREKNLTPSDEKRVDEQGRPIVTREPWSQVHTGIYLSLCGSREPLHVLEMQNTNGMGTEVGGLFVTLTTTVGYRPGFSKEAWGISLELPADLGHDTLKQGYVMEWLVASMTEIFELALGANAFRGIPAGRHQEFAMWLHLAADQLIKRTGL